MENVEFEKSKAFFIDDVLDYVPNSIVMKTIMRKTTGHVSAVSFDAGEVLIGKISPFDTFIQIIQGKAEVIVDHKSTLLETGESMIIPGHCHNTLKAHVRFKMITTYIKSGYEEMV